MLSLVKFLMVIYLIFDNLESFKLIMKPLFLLGFHKSFL
jgi:hypothetical protein